MSNRLAVHPWTAQSKDGNTQGRSLSNFTDWGLFKSRTNRTFKDAPASTWALKTN
jgi:hypothetical protein